MEFSDRLPSTSSNPSIASLQNSASLSQKLDDLEDERDRSSTEGSAISRIFINGEAEDMIRPRFGGVNNMQRVADTFSTISAEELDSSQAWIKNKKGKDYFVSLLTIMYSLLLIAFSLIFELSPTWSTSTGYTETVYHAWMHGLGALFLIYIYLFMLYPKWWNTLIFSLHRRNMIASPNKWTTQKVDFNGEGVGTLYLRLGAVFFGCLSIVLFGLEIFLCAREQNCKSRFVVQDCLLILFVALQMHFTYCNTKMTITSSTWICKMGFMHLVAVNLWTWFRFVVAKQQTKIAKKLKKKLAAIMETTGHLKDGEGIHDDGHSAEIIRNLPSAGVLAESLEFVSGSELLKNTNTSRTLASVDYLGDVASIFTTCLVEYALIGAAVMFVLWASVDSIHRDGTERVGRKSKMRIDCTNTSGGLFMGVLMVILTFISMGIIAVYYQLHMDEVCKLATAIFLALVYAMCILGTIIALVRMRGMKYKDSAHGEFLDQILMVFGMASEFLYCACEIDMFLTGKDYGAANNEISVFTFIIFVIRLVQVVLQSTFILMSFRLSAANKEELRKMGGRQMVTYLLVANVALFFFHIYEGISVSIGFEASPYSAFEIIIYAVTPVIAFYRFHSSVCLAEIWKHSYTSKSRQDVVSASGITSQYS